MNLNFFGVACLVLGGVILYGTVKNTYPDDIIRQFFGQEPVHGPIAGVWSYGKKLTPSALDNLPPATGVPVVTV